MMPVPEESNHSEDSPNYKQKYKTLKRKLKFLLYEQEYFQDELKRVQKKLLRVSRDKSFLLDRLLQYENIDHISTDEEGTASSSGASDTEAAKVYGEAPHTSSKSKKSHLASHAASVEGLNPFAHTEATTSRTPDTSSKMVLCKFTSNGKQCQELVSKRSKSGYCNSHRAVVRISKQYSGGKGSKSNPSEGIKITTHAVEQAEQLERLHRLSESSAASQVPRATEQLPHEMFNIEDEEQDSENEDSTGSPSFQGNMYEGDDDLVIDLPE
ncbi:uncharacterized protein LOC116616239 [Nematostella vectensis]|uniref:uncharacterized protein LOC116616239 n=1 Tax=Nematostella vectensis TaxID=45351 RepID=UPI002077267B|nr:uncharacterized protein LOC116616239 [Nematostella vectensis]